MQHERRSGARAGYGVPFAPQVGEEEVGEPQKNVLDKARRRFALAASGHTSCAVGHLIVNIGGTRHYDPRNQLHMYVLDILQGVIFTPRFAKNSARPGRRTRHDCCVVRPASSISVQGLPSVLMLGGYHDLSNEPCQGLSALFFLEFTASDGSEVCWREETADGMVPQGLWHHQCDSFSNGKRVVAFGGDMPLEDPEYPSIAERVGDFVYLLDVDARRWDRIVTSGNIPCWRSLHKGVCYTSLSDGEERFVIMGGSMTRVPQHGQFGDLADMAGYCLNLHSYRWHKGDDSVPAEIELQSEDGSATETAAVDLNSRDGAHMDQHQSGAVDTESEAESGGSESGISWPVDNPSLPPGSLTSYLPEPRMRFGADRYGRFLLVYGGHGSNMMVSEEEQLLKLNLVTLAWSRINVWNEPHSYAFAPCAQIASGIITGGVTITPIGIRPAPKLDVILTCPPRLDLACLQGEELDDDTESDGVGIMW